MNERFVFFGTDEFVVPVLEALFSLPYECVAVVTTPDKKGRKGEQIPSAIKRIAQTHGVDVFTPQKMKDFFETYKSLQPDFAVVASYGKIIPQSFIEATPKGILNIHPSLLPRHRGPSPVPATILAGDKKTGVAIMKIDAGVDTGDILDTAAIDLIGRETTPELLDLLFVKGADLLKKILPSYLSGKLTPRKQKATDATHSTFFSKEDGKIDFNDGAQMIERKVRALNPWPGTHAKLEGQMIKILSTHYEDSLKNDLTPGTIRAEKNKIFVATPDGLLEILTLQPEGKKPQTAEEFLRGHQVDGKTFS